MRTLFFILAGLALLVLAIVIARNSAKDRRLATLAVLRMFGIVWFVIAAANMGEGMRAGYPVEQELPIFLLIFGIPAAAAYWAGKRA